MCSIFYSAVVCAAAHVVLLSLAFSLCTLSGDTVVCKCVGYAHTHRASTHTHTFAVCRYVTACMQCYLFVTCFVPVFVSSCVFMH